MVELIKEMKNITARYFVTCLTAPDTFDLYNDILEIKDKSVPMAGFGGGDMQAMMEAAMMGGGMPSMNNPESLGSD